MKANKYRGNARKGALRETITHIKNNGIKSDANERVTKTITRQRYVKDKPTLAKKFWETYYIDNKGWLRLIPTE